MNEIEDPDLAAAEYVLGTLDGGERAVVAARRLEDPHLDQAIGWWQLRLGALSEVVSEVEAPHHVFVSLMKSLNLAPARAETDASGSILQLRRRVRLWQFATVASGALAAALLAWVGLWEPHGISTELLAVLQKEADGTVVLLDVDLASRRLTIRPVGAAPPAGKSLELWIIDKSLGAPRSLGTVPTDRRTQASLAPYSPDVITGATYAITVEPAGGSPTGAPSSAPVLQGHVVPSSL